MSRAVFASVLSLLFAFASPASARVADTPNDVHPILVGTTAPDAPLTGLDRRPTTLKQQLAGKPTVLVFYRGGWCPYCNLQLSELRKLKGELKAKGFQLLAISPDRIEEIAKTLDDDKLDYALASDADARALEAFGIAYRLDDQTFGTYRDKYGIDLEARSGHDHHVLPVPSVFVIDAQGVIQFAYVNPDYRTRVPLRLVRAAMDAVSLGEAGKPLK